MEESNGDQKNSLLAKKTPNDNNTTAAKIEGLEEKKGAEKITNPPNRQKLEKSNSFFDETEGSFTERNFRTMLNRNAAANPGASLHTPRR
jgi:hypothetical protein